MKSLTRKALNTLSGSRMVGIEEAVHGIMHFDLTICSDTTQALNLSMFQTLLHKGKKKKGEIW